ncbi:NUDIX hydrolase [Methylogaea oryzae]|uniref:Phosphatase NudJ n=1 Tax=Methylogaea oryzae TaxID=1295382 RepID=A0A8D4VLX8_9GAMM|nr:NUDIX hydrolase [Methylogaea oryzae]BBL70250.1 NUDIX hydrolase [Methylogaea oryzae]
MNQTLAKRPAVTVAAVAERDGRFLVVEEHDSAGRLVINQPAGHLEPGEDILSAVMREALEETGWTFRPEFLLGVYLWEHPSKTHSYLRLAFGGKALEHDPARPLDDGIVHALWLTPDELAARGPQLRSPLVLQCVHDYLAGGRYPLELIKAYGGF